jgi:hypothetical protein
MKRERRGVYFQPKMALQFAPPSRVLELCQFPPTSEKVGAMNRIELIIKLSLPEMRAQ